MRALIAAALGCTACGRLDFRPQGDAAEAAGAPDGTPACAAMGALYCDDFDRDVPIAPDDPVWASQSCTSVGATLSVGGTLDISYPAFAGGSVIGCQLLSHPTAEISALTLDFDFTFTGGPTSNGVNLAVPMIVLGQPNAIGIKSEFVQLAIGETGRAGIDIVYYYPDAAMSPDGTNYPGFDVADSAGTVWMPPGVACHITLTADTTIPTANATATCADVARSFVVRSPTIPTGFSGPLTLSLGYANPAIVTGVGASSYDNMVLRATP